MDNLITHTYTHIQVSLIPPWEDQCEWHRMTRMTGPDCAVIMCNLINTPREREREREREKHTHAPDSAKAEGSSIVDEPGEG